MPQIVTYGKSIAGNVAIVRGANRTHGVWDACEVDGELYHVCGDDELTEDEMDRADDLLD